MMVNVRRPWRLQSPHEKFFKREIGAHLGCNPRSVTLDNIKDFQYGHRFLYFRTSKGFGKLASDQSSKLQLIKEEHRTLWANQINLPTAKILRHYQETPSGYGILLLEKLTARHGTFINDISELEYLSPQKTHTFARLSVDTILKSSYLPVSNFQIEQFPCNETAQSPATMLLHAHKWVELFSNPQAMDALIGAFPELEESLEHISRVFTQLLSVITTLVDGWGYSEVPYFVHNDASIKNMYFKRKGFTLNDAFLIDFEHSTATHYPVLGMLKDLADLYGATAHNPELHRSLIENAYAHKYVHLPYLGMTDQMHLLMRAVIAYGTLNFCQSVLFRVLEQENPSQALLQDEQRELVRHLLQQLIPNLTHLENLATSEQAASQALQPSF